MCFGVHCSVVWWFDKEEQQQKRATEGKLMNLKGFVSKDNPFLIQSENHRTMLPTVGWIESSSALGVPVARGGGAKIGFVMSLG